MIKVLLAYEDFNELTLTESYLKKIGFDVLGISNEVLLQDQLLIFNPDIVVAYGRNNKVSSFSIGQKMKDNHRFHGKVIIIVPKDVRPTPADMLRMKMDAIVEAPVPAEKLIQVLTRLSGQSSQLYLDKFQKIRQSDPELARKMMLISGSPAAPPTTSSPTPAQDGKPEGVRLKDPQRAQKYAKWIKDIHFDPQQSTHQRKDLKDKQKELKKDWDFDKLEEIDQLKRDFAEALFKKK